MLTPAVRLWCTGASNRHYLRAAFCRGEGRRIGDYPEVPAAFFELAHQYLIWAPEIILTVPVLSDIFRAAAVVILHQEGQSTRCALEFVTNFIVPDEALVKSSHSAWKRNWSLIEQCVYENGQTIVSALLIAACDILPPQLHRAVAKAMSVLCSSFPSHAGQWVASIFRHPEFPAIQSGALRPIDQGRFLELVTRQPALPIARFQDMMVEFISVMRKRSNGDVLLAYR
ncbi:hypothetical protein CBR_g30755 [Chara braunii]|uniref:Uncharacterized protein n=1 Tax=Chara braunii TaxID=69332 RepID=A0A388LDN3_CHABU|nr:hypothetical protein CBR_g30755 [Chara braunii]|eukprot:GBG80387.1 hypothetical protein CBR_g30755 [Chara braunii]